MPRPPGHGPQYEVRRQSIIDAAARLFAVQGYAATGTAELCAEVGVGKGNLYYYIGSKENLLVEIQNRVLQPLLHSARTIDALDVPAVLKLRLVSRGMLEIIEQRTDHIWVYEHDYRQLGTEHRKRIVAQRHEFENVVRKLIAEAAEEAAADIDADLLMLQFLNMHNYTYQWIGSTRRWSPDRLSAEYCATLLRGFGLVDSLDDIEKAAAALVDEQPQLFQF